MKAIKYILVIAFLHQLTRFFDNTYRSIQLQLDDSFTYACKNDISDWVKSVDIAMYYTTYYTFRILFVFIIPIFALIVLNCLLFRALKRAKIKRTELLNPKFKALGMGNNRARSSITTDIGGPRNSINELTSGGHVFMSSSRKLSTEPSIAIAQGGKLRTKNNNTARGKKRRFYIKSFRLKYEPNSVFIEDNDVGDGDDDNLLQTETKVSDNKKKQQFSDAKHANCSGGDDVQSAGRTKLVDKMRNVNNNENNNNDKISSKNNDSITLSKNRRAMNQKQISEEMNQSCNSMSANHNHGYCRGLESCKNDQKSCCQQPLLRKNQQKQQSSSNENSNEDTNSGMAKLDEDGFVCAECANCEQHNQGSAGCRRCSADANEGATGDQGNQHQPISQCSSLLAGPTTTTTNEDVSSCLVTQNASSSMFVVNDGNLEATEVASMRGEDVIDIEDQEDNPALDQIVDSRYTSACGRANGNREETKGGLCVMKGGNDETLIRSGSDDSRLACGCLVSTTRSMPLKQIQSSTRNNAESCTGCCSLSNCQKSAQKSIKIARGVENKDSFGDSCSISEPCINRTKSNERRAMFCDKQNAQTTESDPNNNYDDKDLSNNINDEEDVSTKRSILAASASDEVGETIERESDKTKNAIFENNSTTTSKAPSNTTSTALYSTANSFGSTTPNNYPSGQKASPSNQVGGLLNQQQQLTTTRNPSFSWRGRGSSNPPHLVVSGGFVPTTTAFMRTMDNNRTTLMLIVVVSVFLIVEVPVAIVTILHVVFNSFDIFRDVELSSFSYIKLFTNFIIMISYSVNFSIYCSMSKKFRETFRDLFLWGKKAKRKRADRMLFQQSNQQQHSQFNNPHQFNSQDQSQININKYNDNSNMLSCTSVQNYLTSTVGGSNHTNAPLLAANNMTRYYPCRKLSSQHQQECEL